MRRAKISAFSKIIKKKKTKTIKININALISYYIYNIISIYIFQKNLILLK